MKTPLLSILNSYHLTKPSSQNLIFPPSMAESRLRELSPMGGLLPLDLISLILARLPVKCILRLKCVCKLWLAIITSPDFANLHLRFNSLPSHDRLLILAGEDHCLYSFSLGSPEFPAMKITNLEGLRFNSILGSCHGLLLCVCGEAPNSYLVLVNPSTLSYRRVPNLQVPQNYMDVSYGFGFDSVSNDYKIVRIVHLFYGYANGSAFNGRQVMVYSFRNDCWKMVEEDVCLHKKPGHRNGVLVNSHLLHWLLWYPSLREHRIASFDVCSEKWSEVPMPDYIENGPINPKNRMAWRLYGMDKENDMVDLGVLDGCLCLLTKNYRRLFGEVDVWVMKEYGVKDSWVRLFDASDLDITGSLEVAPIAYSQEGSEVLLRTFNLSRVFWYNLREKRATSADFQGVRNYCQVNVCIPSLISLPTLGEISKQNQQISRKEEY